MAITFSIILDRFAKFIHCCKEDKIFNKTAMVIIPTTHYVCCCITVKNLKVRNLHFACT